MIKLSIPPFFWQTEQWQQLTKRWHSQTLPHAILLTGPTGLGKDLFAHEFAKLILCNGSTNATAACQKCRNCELIQIGNHPAFYPIRAEEKGKAIRIDQIRDLVYELNQTSLRNGYKVAIISAAETMNLAAANALLKTLEEPSASTLIMLVSSHAAQLPATIRSRCQTITFHVPKQEKSLPWLADQLGNAAEASSLLTISEGAPLLALHLKESAELRQRLLNDLRTLSKGEGDPIKIANNWLKTLPSEVIDGLISATMEAIRRGAVNLFTYLDQLYKLRQYTQVSTSLNQQLLYEEIFCNWHEYTRTNI